jgi:hypothetical protein
MKKIVDGKLYDTQTAESLGEWSDNNFNHYSLYRTRKGAYFVLRVDMNNQSHLEPLPKRDEFNWLVKYGGDAQAAELFPDRVEEA